MPQQKSAQHPILDRDDDRSLPDAGIGWDHEKPVSFGRIALTDPGLYIAGTDPRDRSELLTQHLVQCARMDSGFCYFHPDHRAVLDLLSKLPADRLNDVIWIDLDREVIRGHHNLEVPRWQRVVIPPLSPDTPVDDPDSLVTPPVQARVSDFIDVFEQDDRIPWTGQSLLAAILPVIIENGDTVETLAYWLDRLHEFDDPAARPSRQGTMRDPRILEAVTTVQARDPEALELVGSLLDRLTDLGYVRASRGHASTSFRDAVQDDAIILVAGEHDRPASDWGTPLYTSMRGFQLLATSVLRRLWEALQYWGQRRRQRYPIAIDGVDHVLPHDPTILREILRTSDTIEAPTRAALWITGPPTGHLPAPLAERIEREFDAWALLQEGYDRELRSLYRRLKQAADPDASAPSMTFAEWSSWMVPTPTSEPAPFRRFPPYPVQRTPAELEAAITRSCTDHSY